MTHEEEIYTLKDKVNKLKEKKEQLNEKKLHKVEMDTIKAEINQLERETAEPLPGEETVKKIGGWLYKSPTLRAIVRFIDKITEPDYGKKKKKGEGDLR